MLALVAELYVESSALVAAIRQEPYLVAVIVAEEELFERLQFSAVPPETIAYVTAPDPEPPEVDMVKACE